MDNLIELIKAVCTSRSEVNAPMSSTIDILIKIKMMIQEKCLKTMLIISIVSVIKTLK